MSKKNNKIIPQSKHLSTHCSLINWNVNNFFELTKWTKTIDLLYPLFLLSVSKSAFPMWFYRRILHTSNGLILNPRWLLWSRIEKSLIALGRLILNPLYPITLTIRNSYYANIAFSALSCFHLRKVRISE